MSVATAEPRRWAVAALALLLLAYPSVAAQGDPSGSLYGRLLFAQHDWLEGVSAALLDSGAVLSKATEGEQVRASLTIEAESAFVKVVRDHDVGIGQVGGGGSFLSVNTDTKRIAGDSFGKITIHGETWQNTSSALIRGNKGALGIGVDTHQRTGLAPAAATRWLVGSNSDSVTAQEVPGYQGDSTTETHSVDGGIPLFSSAGQVDVTADGSAFMVLWGINITVTPDDGGDRTTYSSGAWTENETVHGRDRYFQLISLTLQGATVQYEQRTGGLLAVAKAVDTKSVGRLEFYKAKGFLSSATAVDDVDGETLTLDGTFSERVVAGREATLLQTDLAGYPANADLPPTAGGGLTTIRNLQIPLFVAVLVLLSVGLYGGWRWWTSRSEGLAVGSELLGAEDALIEGDHHMALQRAERAVRRKPNDVGAWFVYAASLQLRDQHDRVRAEVEPVAERLGKPPSLAFVVGVSHLRMGEVDAAERWLRIAATEPTFRRTMQLNPLFEPFRQGPRRAAWLADPSATSYV